MKHLVIIGAFMSLDGVMQAPGGPEEGDGCGFKLAADGQDTRAIQAYRSHR